MTRRNQRARLRLIQIDSLRVTNPMRLLTILLVASFVANIVSAADPLPPVLAMDSLGLPYRTLFQTETCTITAVKNAGEILNVEFNGRWLSTPHAQLPGAGKNGFVVQRNEKTSQAVWDALVRRLAESRGKPVTILVYVDQGYLIRGGIPMFTLPEDRFQIFREGEPVKMPVGFQF